MEELDVTSAWILSNFITISTMTMNMKWTCPEKTISLPPSQAITPLFPTLTVVKIRHSHSMIIFFLSPSFSFSSWSVPESSGYLQGGDWLRPLGGTAVDSGGRGFWGSTLVSERRLSRLMGQPTPPNKDTHTHTHRHRIGRWPHLEWANRLSGQIMNIRSISVCWMHTLHAEIWGKDLALELSQLFLLGCMHLRSVARGPQESDKHTPLHVVWATQLGLKDTPLILLGAISHGRV